MHDAVDPPADLETDAAAPRGGEALPPGLYLVATPIGNARDITLRALDILRAADVLAAEDTRRLRQLMQIHGIPLAGRRIIAHHDHNGPASAQAILTALTAGETVAYASDAGTPMIADPGYLLVRAATEAGVAVHGIPGASAVLTALTVAGLPTDRFVFAGFPPAARGARRSWLAEVAAIRATAVLYESPRRVRETFNNLCEIDPEREMVVCRELTKRFEEVMRGTAAALRDRIPEEGLRGEVVIVLAPPAVREVTEDSIRQALARRLGEMSVRDAATEVAAELGVPRKQAYQLAMTMER